MATAAIQAECRQTIFRVEDDTVTLRGNWGTALVLPEWPADPPSSVRVEGLEYTNGVDWAFANNTIYRGIPDFTAGTYASTGLHWGGPDLAVSIVYSHGYTVIPDVAKGICVAIAARGIMNPAGVKVAESIGQYSVTFAQGSYGGGSVGLLPSEVKALYRAGIKRC